MVVHSFIIQCRVLHSIDVIKLSVFAIKQLNLGASIPVVELVSGFNSIPVLEISVLSSASSINLPVLETITTDHQSSWNLALVEEEAGVCALLELNGGGGAKL